MRNGESSFPVSWNKIGLFGLILNYTDTPAPMHDFIYVPLERMLVSVDRHNVGQ